MVGSAIVRRLEAIGRGGDLVLRTRSELDLEDEAATRRFFETERPWLVFHAAAEVGGILANCTRPADFLLSNLRVQNSVLSAAQACGVERLIFLGSSCIYPRDCPQPIREEYLLSGRLEGTNRPYAIAKIAGIELCWALNRQHGTRFLATMPTNLYGPGDNYDPHDSHVMPALIRKMHEARIANAPYVSIWGSGTPRREFLHCDDLARAVVHLALLDEARYNTLTDPLQCPLINIGSGEDQTIGEIASEVARAVGYRGEFRYDRSKPDGTPRKVLDISRIRGLGWQPEIGLRQGLEMVVRDYRWQAGFPAAA
jgi:GDP-L-fucose synthase